MSEKATRKQALPCSPRKILNLVVNASVTKLNAPLNLWTSNRECSVKKEKIRFPIFEATYSSLGGDTQDILDFKSVPSHSLSDGLYQKESFRTVGGLDCPPRFAHDVGGSRKDLHFCPTNMHLQICNAAFAQTAPYLSTITLPS